MFLLSCPYLNYCQGFFLNLIPFLSFARVMALLTAPQDLPYSNSSLARILFLYIVTGLLVLVFNDTDLLTAVALLAMDLLVLVGFIKFCLYTRNNTDRYQQTLFACLGVGVFFQLLSLPLILMIDTAADTATAINVFAGFYYLALVCWQITVIAHILRHAMNMQLTQTLLLSFSYFILIIFLSNQVVALLATA